MSRILLKNGSIVLRNEICAKGSLLVGRDKIIALNTAETPAGLEKQMEKAEDESRVVDLGGDILIPGLIDTHVHGTGGFDSMDLNSGCLTGLGHALLREGTIAYLPTTMACLSEELVNILLNIRSEMNWRVNLDRKLLSTKKEVQKSAEYGAEILGVHLEGPFLAMGFRGAQPRDNIFPWDGRAMPLLEELTNQFPRLIRILTLAVERPDARELIKHCLKLGIIPSAGHTGAAYEVMQEAFNWGLRHLTHAFNAMPSIHHRQPGLLTLALTNSEVMIELIADGVHIHPGVLEMALQLKPVGKVCLISDGTRAVGLPDGDYELGGQLTKVRQGTVRLADGTLAGTAQPLLHGLRFLVNALKWPLPKAVRYASLNPARLLGIDDRLGSLEIGKEATFLRLSSELSLKEVWLKGKLVIKNGDCHDNII